MSAVPLESEDNEMSIPYTSSVTSSEEEKDRRRHKMS